MRSREKNQELDRYSAALAGTHFLRQERDKVIKDTTNPIAHLYLSVSGLCCDKVVEPIFRPVRIVQHIQTSTDINDLISLSMPVGAV